MKKADYLKKADNFKWKWFIYSFMNYHSKHEDPFAQSHQKQNEKKQITYLKQVDYLKWFIPSWILIGLKKISF